MLAQQRHDVFLYAEVHFLDDSGLDTQTLGALKSEGVGAIAYHKFHTSHIRCLEVAYKVLTVGSVAGNEDGNVHLSEELGVLLVAPLYTSAPFQVERGV